MTLMRIRWVTGYPSNGLEVRRLHSFITSSLTLISDWKLNKPKMHISGRSDPPPDAGDFSGHVKCEHGCLALNTNARRRVSVEVRRVFEIG